MELNPNHPVASGFRDQYHTILAFMLWKFFEGHCTITRRDLDAFTASYPDGVALIAKLLLREGGQ